ncbi:helix-turn-helix domain-containing protein [Vescimonas sanitatis]|uniref:helix-turn-helix domain-containing protein n=1 Tax=Vescimonas sanitatis TaxID=3376993 RepID=UPI003B76600C
MDKNTTGRFIAELRKQKGFTQKELAENLMVTDKAISRWETGKGLPDTSLLKPLGDVLGVSVTELLSGKKIEEVDMKERADNIILEALNYSKRMLASVISVTIFIIGIAFIISPLFLASKSYIWTLGLIIVAIAILYIYTRKRGYSMKATDRVYYLAALALQGIALVLEVLPIGVVMVFATSPTKQTIEVYSYFSLLPVGYANFTPLLTGILTILIILLGAIALFRFDRAASIRKTIFVCSIISLLFSIVPLFLFGTVGMTVASYAVSCAILLSICLQAVANRKE